MVKEHHSINSITHRLYPITDVNNTTHTSKNNKPASSSSSSSSSPVHHHHHHYASSDDPGTTTTNTKWVTRDIAALDFLLGIPMARQGEVVRRGWTVLRQGGQHHHHQQQGHGHGGGGGRASSSAAAAASSATGKWWEQLAMSNGDSNNNNSTSIHPHQYQSLQHQHQQQEASSSIVVVLEGPQRGGGRRLDGDAAVKVQIPLAADSKSTRQRNIARQAQIREWELLQLQQHHHQEQHNLLGGRIFFSAKDNYPVSVFSVIKYEPKREEAARRRKKLEERGGGGSQFVVPERDWRGTSYRALLMIDQQQPHRRRRHRHRTRRSLPEGGGGSNHKKQGAFNRFLTPGKHDEKDDDASSSSSFDDSDSEEEDTYLPGFLDDPEMRQGRHRHVMIGDRVSGCIVSSTIQFVKPADLKADLNKQFRERFDGWEPPKSQHKYIGAKVNDGAYTLIDPTVDSVDEENIRMPPSLTLSKIRSLKQQALLAAVDAHLEISTMALAVVYFERLCLDCRVDKSNRRLAFAACMLLAAKINEANVVGLVMQQEDNNEKKGLQSLIRPSKKSATIFASLLEFFTHDWSLSLKHLFSAEWGVFAALGFRLHATPSQVEFHFRRLMKVLGWNGLAYLGHEMYTQWQDCLETEERRLQDRETRREMRREYKERKLLKLELQRQKEEKEWQDDDREHHNDNKEDIDSTGGSPTNKPKHQTAAMKLLNRFTSLARPASTIMEPMSLNDRRSFTSTHHLHSTPALRRMSMKKSSSIPDKLERLSSAAAAADAAASDAVAPPQHVAIDIVINKEAEQQGERSEAGTSCSHAGEGGDEEEGTIV